MHFLYFYTKKVATPFGITTLFCHVSTSIATSYTLLYTSNIIRHTSRVIKRLICTKAFMISLVIVQSLHPRFFLPSRQLSAKK